MKNYKKCACCREKIRLDFSELTENRASFPFAHVAFLRHASSGLLAAANSFVQRATVPCHIVSYVFLSSEQVPLVRAAGKRWPELIAALAD